MKVTFEKTYEGIYHAVAVADDGTDRATAEGPSYLIAREELRISLAHYLNFCQKHGLPPKIIPDMLPADTWPAEPTLSAD